MLAALLAPDISFMGENLLWLLVGTGLCLLVGWQILRRRADAPRIDGQAEREAAARAEAQSQAELQAEEERLAAERAKAERIDAERQREADEQAERERVAALEAEREAQRQAAEQAAREAEAQAEAQRQGERRAEEERQAVARELEERVAAARRREAAERAERERMAAVEAEREAQRLAAEQAARDAEAQRQAERRAEEERLAAERAERERLAALAAEQEAQRRLAEQTAREAQALAEARRLAEVRAEQERVAAERAPVERVAMGPRRANKTAMQTLVLVADDSKVVRIKTGRLLAQHQYQIAYATDGLDAVQQMQAQLPDVVITDVEMPGMDGFELTRHIRANPQTAQLPVIMITAADDRHREQADSAGVSVLLGKPYPEDALIAHIRLAMGQDGAAPLSAATRGHGALDTVT